MKKILTTIGIAALILIWVSLAVVTWFKPTEEMIISERRPANQPPKLSLETILAEDDYDSEGNLRKRNSFMSLFEANTLDKFPLREQFRQVKSLFTYYVMQQKDNNNIYVEDGYAATLIYPMEEDKINANISVLHKVLMQNRIQEKCNVYVSVIPDKGYFLAQQNGYLSMDYDKIFTTVENRWPAEKFPNVHYVDITDLLSIEDYYRTDTHWRQEKLLPVANKLAEAMGVTVQQESDYTIDKAEASFYGVYYRQAALPMKSEPLYVMRSQLLDECKVSVFDGEEWTNPGIYNSEMLKDKDQYAVFLSGNNPIIHIENPNAATNKELVVFRDSFGSSLTPLLVKDYAKVTLVDLRYIDYTLLQDHVTFDGQDVLFLFNTQVLNSSLSLRK